MLVSDQQSINPNRLTVEQLAKMLSSAAKKLVSEEQIEQDIAEGAPVNADGTLNLIHYTAWNVKELAHGQ